MPSPPSSSAPPQSRSWPRSPSPSQRIGPPGRRAIDSAPTRRSFQAAGPSQVFGASPATGRTPVECHVLSCSVMFCHVLSCSVYAWRMGCSLLLHEAVLWSRFGMGLSSSGSPSIPFSPPSACPVRRDPVSRVSCVRAGVRFAPARVSRARLRARDGGRTSPVRSRRGFFRPQPLLPSAEERKGGPGGPPLYSHHTPLSLQSSPLAGEI